MQQETGAPTRARRQVAALIGFALLYALAMLAGRATHIPGGTLALAWPAAGVAVVWFLTVTTLRQRLVAFAAITVVSGVVNGLTGVEVVGGWLFGPVNAVHGWVGAAVLWRLGGWRGPRAIASFRDFGQLAVASVAAALVSGVSGGLVASARFDAHLGEGFGLITFRNALSTFVITAALLALPEIRRQKTSVSLRVGCALFVTASLGVSVALMSLPWPLSFGLIPPLLVVALRCGTPVTAVVIALQGVIIVAMTVAGHGPLVVVADVGARTLIAELLILVIAVVGLSVALAEDERNAALLASRMDHERLRAHMDAALVAGAHLTVAPDGTVRTVEVNHALVTLTGVEAEDLIGSDPSTWLSALDAVHLRCALTVMAGGAEASGWREQARMAPEYGGRWIDAALSLVGTPPGSDCAEITLQMVDITAQRRAEQELAHAALHDELTGLPNRTLWRQRLAEALTRAAPDAARVTALYVDIDHFKSINDTYGHEAGDVVLSEVARRLRQVIGVEDTVARIGGDEFLVLSPGTSTPDEGLRAADRIHQVLTPAIAVGVRTIAVTVSVGIAMIEPGEQDGRLLLRRADAALYAAKAAGRARSEVYCLDLHESIERAARLLVDIERGHRAGEFGVHYQPIVHARTGRTVALEALVRWHHPQRGLLGPGEFLEVLEASDLIHRVGLDVLRQACEDGAALLSAGTRLSMQVNLGASELARPGLVDSVRDQLTATGFPPELLVLEVTETRIVTVDDTLIAALTELNDLGVRVAVDDFGTGFSTLTHLVDLPVGIVKLDRSFVAEVVSGTSARSVTSGVRAMADGLGIEAIAEGVETAEQAEVLVALGFQLLQGYHFGRPAPLEQFMPDLLRIAG